MADRFWVGGTENWNSFAGTKWATTSGGAGGASVPTSADDVYFDAASGSGIVTITAAAQALSLNTTGFTGTIAGTASLRVDQNLTISSGVTFTYSGTISMTDGSGTATITTAGKTLGSLTLGDATSTATFSLQDALTMTGTLTLTGGIFTTNNFNVTAASLSSSNTSTRTINLGSSTLTLSGGAAVNFFSSTGLTLNAGTSLITMSNGFAAFNGGSKTYHNISFTSTSGIAYSITGTNVFNNVTVAARTSYGITIVNIGGDHTINGTLTLSAGTNATRRTFIRSDTIGTTRTLTCAAVASLTDIDFRDIVIAGAAAPVSGTRLGDCKGNSGITFPSPKTVYYSVAGSDDWSGTVWATTSGGTPAINNFPLAQDTAVIDNAVLPPPPDSTITITSGYNIGTINMSARTSNAMTLNLSASIAVYGNWINGTGVTLSGTNVVTFAGRGSQTITSAGVTFTYELVLNSPNGSLTLQDAFTSNSVNATAFGIFAGTFSIGSFTATLSGLNSGFTIYSSGSYPKTFDSGTGTLIIGGTGGWIVSVPTTNTSVIGSGTISLTSSSGGKTFYGADIQTYHTINQGGTTPLTITGSNRFVNITNTAIGPVYFFGGTTQDFTNFNLNGSSGNTLWLRSTDTTQVTLRKPSAWNVGVNSINSGNNTGLSFTGTNPNWLDISYINGVVSSTGNFMMLF